MLDSIDFIQWFEQTASQTIQNIINQTKDEITLHHSLFAKQSNLVNNKYQTITPQYMEYCLKEFTTKIHDDLLQQFNAKDASNQFTVKTKNKSAYDYPKGNQKPCSALDVAQLQSSYNHLFKYKEELAFIDLETDGLDTNKCNILQIGITQIQPTKYSVWKTYLKPHANYTINTDSQSFKVNKIGQDLIWNAPYYTDIQKELLDQLDGKILIGYNINKFDIPILKRMIESNQSSPNWKGTIDLGKIYWKNRAPGTFEHALHHFNIHTENELHDAAEDSKNCIHLLAKMMEQGMIPIPLTPVVEETKDNNTNKRQYPSPDPSPPNNNNQKRRRLS
jgi:uncharacterized protein YprB with RNaseH-like and TPR domain